MSQMKKFLASRATESAAGRKAIVSKIGEEGHQILHHLKAAAVKFTNLATGKQMKQHLMKLILKVAILVENGTISTDEARPLGEPTRDLAIAVIHALQKEEAAARVAAASTIRQKLQDCHVATMPLIQGRMKESNSGRLTILIGYYGNEAFLSAFLGHADYAEDRDSLLHNLQLVLHQTGQSQEARQLEEARRMKQLEQFKTVLENPSLRTFQNDAHGATIWDEWLLENKRDALVIRAFLRNINDYSKMQNRPLAVKRARTIMDSFVASGKIRVTQDAVDSINADIETGEVRRGLFDPAKRQAEAELNDVFVNEFMPSEAFRTLREDTLAVGEANAAANLSSVVDDDDD